MQMEVMQDHPEPTLNGMKEFLGMNVTVPAWNMRNVNSRHGERGRPMKRHEYEHLVDIARADARRVARVLDKYEAGDGAAFVARWEQVWQGVLDECEGDQCYVDSN
jgi:predicted secreted Zn-dependent protease